MAKRGVILLVDADDIHREKTAEVLEKEGFAVLLEEDYDEALIAFKTNRSEIDLVILETTLIMMKGRMPPKDFIGIDLAKTIRVKRLVPIIFVSHREEVPPEVYSLGMLLTKPMLPSELLGAVEEALSAKSAGA